MTLPVHLHQKVLGPKPAAFFHKDLIRRIQSLRLDPAGVFAWRRESTDSITLFGMLAGCGKGSANLAAQAAAGRRFGLALLKAGLAPRSFSSVSDEEWANLYDLGKDAFRLGWANGNDDMMRKQAPDMIAAIEFDFSTEQFLSSGEIAAKASKHEAIWDDYVSRCGIPTWFGGKMLDVFMDVLVRTDDQGKNQRQAIAVAESRKGLRSTRAKANAEVAVIDAAISYEFETLRFYRGSPTQFAAFVMSRGLLLGTYCGAAVSSIGKDLYDEIREKGAGS